MIHPFHKFSLFLLSACVVATPAFGQQAPVVAASTTSQPPEIKQMQHLEDQWDDALARHDQYGLELVLAPQFIDISSAGDVTTRNQQIARIFLKDNGAPASLHQKVITVRMYGDIAIVNGTYTLQKHGEGGPVEERGVFSHVFQRVRTAWQCINSQRTLVVEESLTKPKTHKKNSASNAELPMHVPGLYQGSEAVASPAPQGAKQ
ncbi:MAG TPA: nuclear transport factor 2 family protein [Acidisarcina sp.]|nr:nuclear transport factor 2 family protein [Acidisarcina sp.]